MEPPQGAGTVEPASWLVFFWPSSKMPWLDRLLPGRFKHVSAAGYVAETATWLFVNPQRGRTIVEAIPDGDEAFRLNGWCDRAEVIVMPRGFDLGYRFRGPFSCVSVVAALLGLRSGALRPDGLYRDCLRAGGRPIADADPEPRPVSGRAAEAR